MNTSNPARLARTLVALVLLLAAARASAQGLTLIEDCYLPDPGQDWLVEGIGDFNRDQVTDVVWKRTNGTETRIWLLSGCTVRANLLLPTPAPGWNIVGVADFNGDGTTDLLWRRTSETGEARVWLLDGFSPGRVLADLAVPPPPPGFRVQGVYDFNGDGFPDILWWNTTSGKGELRVTFLDGNVTPVGEAALAMGTPAGYWPVAIGSFDGSLPSGYGRADIVLQNSIPGDILVMRVRSPSAPSSGVLPGSIWLNALPNPGPGYLVAGLADFSGDSWPRDDLLLRKEDCSSSPIVWVTGSGDFSPSGPPVTVTQSHALPPVTSPYYCQVSWQGWEVVAVGRVWNYEVDIVFRLGNHQGPPRMYRVRRDFVPIEW